ncbi:DNA translocase FtsK [Anatilimnocola aggregata]|uniref:DNA translocase FtsK n=1 Tax=Anatilimnocola aggregata TaxID=2528021 RepID=A0A517YEE2_9BACT|nr:DNA translocase FtsK [Anatilimnocola aggregata]QDU28597.1 DNA translocase FtsK [Anatilimnocola aggregata]
MLEQRNLRLDLTALGLVAVIIFLTCALVTYHPNDPVGPLPPPLSLLIQPDSLAIPANEVTQNACGFWGSLAANLLFTTFGYGAYYLVATLALIDFHLLRRRQIDRPLLRGIGWILSLAGATTIIAVTLQNTSPGPVIGAGGYVGALGKAMVEAHFAAAGGLILMSSITIGGLILCTDDTVMHVARGVADLANSSQRVFGGAHATAEAAAAAKAGKRTRSDLDANSVPDDAASPLKLKGKNKLVLNKEEAAKSPVSVAAPVDDEEEEAPALPIKAPGKTASTAAVAPVASPAAATSNAAQPDSIFKVRNPLEKRKELSEREKLNIDETNPLGEEEYQLPSIELLQHGKDIDYDKQATEVRRKAKILEKTFADFGFNVKVVEIETGPVIAQYEVELEAGLRLSKITNLADDLAIALRVPSVRIVAPIPGKNTVGIEVPNEDRQVVCLREVIEESQSNSKVKKMPIPLYLGKDVSGNAMVADLAALPHLLIAGRTGTGKSVCLNTIITSILMTRGPDEVRMLMIDPKMVELSGYGRLPHLMHPVVTDMRKAEAILAWAVDKMEERYTLLARAGVRHLSGYNQLGEEELMDRLQPENDEERQSIPLQLPYIVIVADELADLMMTSGKEVETHIIRLAQKSRAVGIHLILATQKPTVDVITGLIKSNLPARIAFQVASRTDSRVILDEMGADKLLGMGDMLFLWPGTSTLLRGQGTWVSDDEINSVVAHCSKRGKQNFVHELVNIKIKDEEGAEPAKPGALKKRDELYESAVDLVVREQRGSVSLLQRALGIGYGRAARLIDFMAEDGIVGQYNGSQAREILMTVADWERMQGASEDEEPAKPASRKGAKADGTPGKRNKVTPAPYVSEAPPEMPTAKKSRTVTLVHEEKEELDDEPDEELADDDTDAFAEAEESEDEDIEGYGEEDEGADDDAEEMGDEEEDEDGHHFRAESA